VKDLSGDLGHIAVARNIPLEELPQRVTELEAYLKRPIVIVCRTDKRSVTAAKLLSGKGFSDVHVTHGGMTEWNRSGFPIER
jgi:rhodanese-related sulfurtransferase